MEIAELKWRQEMPDLLCWNGNYRIEEESREMQRLKETTILLLLKWKLQNWKGKQGNAETEGNNYSTFAEINYLVECWDRK